MSTPKALNFHMPPEWAPHAATWLTWPVSRGPDDTFVPDIIGEVEKVYVHMIQALRDGEQVNVLVDEQATADTVSQRVDAHPNVVCHIIPTQDVWIRDYGPTFITNGTELAMSIWQYNAYGKKWPSLIEDDQVAHVMQQQLAMPYFDAECFMEGGAIEVNGAGTCLTTESCLLNPNRNTTMSREAITERLQEYLHVHDVIWLPGGQLSGDDTDGHIDNFARFVNDTTVVCAIEENPNDANYATLQRNIEALSAKTACDIIPLPMPGLVKNATGDRLPASYANFYIGNKVVLVPTYNDARDALVIDLLQSYFPNRRCVGIDARALVWGFGSIHCVTQQQPVNKLYTI